MAVVGLDWNINRVTLNAANNYQAVAPLTVYFDSNYAGQFTVVVSSGSLTPITLTLTGNGTDTYVADFHVRAEDWFTSANNTDTSISLELASEGWVGGSGLGVYLEDAAPECTSFSFVSNWSDPTVFIQYVTSVTATATFDLKFGATIEEVHIYSLFPSGSSIYLSLSQSGDVWTGTRNAPTFMAWGVGDIRLEATDSRGNVCTFYNFSGNPITVYKHGVPTLNIDVFRCDSNGDLDLGGGYIAVTAYATPNPVEYMPSISTVEVTLFDENMGTLVPTQTVTNGTKVVLGSGALDPTAAYNIRVRATDGYSGGAKTKTVLLNPVNRIINVKDGGKGVAFGKVAETDNLVDSGWDIKSAGHFIAGISGGGANAGVVNKTSSGFPCIGVLRTDTNRGIELQVGSGGTNRGLYIQDGNMSGWLIYYNDSNIIFGKPVSPTNLPVASATEAGIVSTGAQTFAGSKTFNSRMAIGTASSDTTEALDVTSNSGRIQLFSTGNANGDATRGLWAAAHGTGGNKSIITVDTNNNVFFSGTWNGSAISVEKGGTGATSAYGARQNLGLGGSANLLSGTLGTTEVTLSGAASYTALIVYGKPSGGAYSSVTIPVSSIGTGGDTWQLADNSNYRSFTVRKSGSDILIKAVAGSGSVTGVRGII